jgi:hypothetical protein
MAKLQDRGPATRQPTRFSRELKKEAKFHDQGSRFRVLAVTNDDLEELEPSFVLMNHPQGCIDLDGESDNDSNDDIESDDDGPRGSCPGLVSSSGSEDDSESDDDEPFFSPSNGQAALEEFETSLVMMNYGSEPEEVDPEELPAAAVLFQTVVEHPSDESAVYEDNAIQPKALGPPSLLPEEEIVYSTLPSSMVKL